MNDEPESEAIKTMETEMKNIMQPDEFDGFYNYTTHKYRQADGTCTRTIDYVFTFKDEDVKGERKFM